MNPIQSWLKEHAVAEVECVIPDMNGNARGKFLPASKFGRGLKMPEGILIQTILGEWPDEYDDLVDPADLDMVLEPDPSTVRAIPWNTEKTVVIVHDCYTKQGELHPLASRTVLRRVLAEFAADGLRPVTAPEMEFYLVSQESNAKYELQAPRGRSGRPEHARQSYSIDAVNEFDDFIEAMYAFAEAQQLDLDTLIHEEGMAQFEVNFLHGDTLDLADQVFTFKRTAREAALRNGMFATFMAKPLQHEPGSAMHVHQSLLDTATGTNVFVDAEGNRTERFRHYLGGLQKYLPAVMSLLAPNVNSYRRFSPDELAPINFNWGFDNRTTALRVPDSEPQDTRIENRLPGSDANAYLAFAATLACGLLGMRNAIEPGEPYVGSAHEAEFTMPRTLEEALRGLDSEPELLELIGPRFAQAFRAVKRAEYESFNQVISTWEREHLLLNV
ncbi:MAG: glutamine synthetase family protein [Pseudomonadota bacterium]